MSLDYDMLLALAPIQRRQVYTERDTILYALGLGIGAAAASDPRHLRYVYEPHLQALPTLATVLSDPGFWMADPRLGIQSRKVVHADQTLELLKPIPIAGATYAAAKIEAIYDKGADKGALIYAAWTLLDEASGDPIARLRQGSFFRGDGGFGGDSVGAPVPHPTPARRPDITFGAITRPEQALIYRLSGDYNPLHADPKAAELAGFAKPVLHGLATYGIAGWAVLTELCGGEPGRLRRLDGRFSRPAFPGDTLCVEIWREDAGRASFQVRSVERDLVVLKNGLVEYEL